MYGLAADFGAVHFNKKANGQVDYYRLDETTVEYAQDIALTLEHEPRQTITTTQKQENGQLILVQKGPLLFFKFIPSTKDGERIYRYVKQRKFRQCSYTYRILNRVRDLENENRLKHVRSINETISIDRATVFEVCLTNNPRDKNTFCTTDAAHPLLRGIVWRTNVTQNEVDYWSEQILYDELDEQIEQIERELKVSERKTKKLLKERGILQ